MKQAETLRYSRQMALAGIGLEGQKNLKNSSVLLIGAGTLSSPLALYLAAAGVGRLGIVDFTSVELSHLHRQVLFSSLDLGKEKSTAAKKHLEELNPEIEILAYAKKLTQENAAELFASYDLIADGADNFSTRYLVNDAAVIAGKPVVSASVLGFEGQVGVFHYQGGPCYRCLYPAPPPGAIPPPPENATLGAMAGVMGSLQATEVLKILLDLGDPLSHHLLFFDALQMEFQKLQVHKNPDCAVCGKNPSIKSVKNTPASQPHLVELDCEEVSALLQSQQNLQILDVRDANEVAICKISPSHHIPLAELKMRLDELTKEKNLIVYCKSGGRSAQATMQLNELGYQAQSMRGGILAWIAKIDPSLKKY